jgi:hypothetical protein
MKIQNTTMIKNHLNNIRKYLKYYLQAVSMHFLSCPKDSLTLTTFAIEISKPTSFITSVTYCCISRTAAGSRRMYTATVQV